MDAKHTTPAMTSEERRRWHEINGIAKSKSPEAEFCDGLVARGIAEVTDAMFGNRYFDLTDVGERAFYGESEEP